MALASPQQLLEDSAAILARYCGINGYFENFLSWKSDSVKRSLSGYVSQFVRAIRDRKSITTLPALAIGLDQLARGIPEGDQLGWYIREVRQHIYLHLCLVMLLDFPLAEITDDAGKVTRTYYKNTQQIWEMIDLLTGQSQKDAIITLCMNRCLAPLMWNKPEMTISKVLAADGVRGAGYILAAISNKFQFTLLLDRLRDLPLQGKARAPWLLQRGGFNASYGANFISRTLEFAPERFDEVFGYLDELGPDDTSSVLLHTGLTHGMKMNLLERAAAVNAPGALFKLLVAALALPDAAKVEQFLHESLKAICRSPSFTPEDQQKMLGKALLLLNAILRLPNQSQAIRILEMQGPSFEGENIIAFSMHYSMPMFTRILEFVAIIEDNATRNRFMEQLFERAKKNPILSKALIGFVLEHPQYVERWLPFTTKSGWNLLHIAASNKEETSGLIPLLLGCINKRISATQRDVVRGQMLAQKNREGNTPLMLAVIHAPGAVESLVEAVSQCQIARGILRLMNDDNDTAFVLAKGSNVTLLDRALQRTSKVPASSSHHGQFFAASRDLSDDEMPPIKALFDDETDDERHLTDDEVEGTMAFN